MAQSPAAFFCAADPTADGHRGATGFRGFGDFSVDLLLLTGYGGGGENLLPTYVLCHVSRCTRLDCPREPLRRQAMFRPPVGSAMRSNGRCALPHLSAPRGAQRQAPAPLRSARVIAFSRP